MVKLRISMLLAVLCGLLLSAIATAQSSKDYARMARATWSAFECASLASESRGKKEQERLFTFGYEQGLKFIAAMKGKQLLDDDLRSEAPLVLLLLLQGPTADFMLGRIYAAAEESALEDFLKSGQDLRSPEDRKLVAANKFRKQNCSLIGVAR